MKHLCAWLLIAAASMAVRAGADGTAWDLEIVPLKPDIYLLQRPEPLRQPVEGNVLVIVNEQDVVVFEGGGMPVAAENAIRLIRSLTDKPVSHLVNSHWHGDHNLGNQVYRAQFPGITIVGHPATRAAMLGAPYRYVTEFDKDLGPTIAEWNALDDRGELSPGRQRLLADLRLLIEDARRIRATGYPQASEFADRYVLHPPTEREMLEIFGRHEPAAAGGAGGA